MINPFFSYKTQLMARPRKLNNAKMRSFYITPKHMEALRAFGKTYDVDGLSAQLRALLDIVAKQYDVQVNQ